MVVFLDNFSLFNHILFMLIIIDAFLNFIEIMSWVFMIEVSLFDCENKVVEEVFKHGFKNRTGPAGSTGNGTSIRSSYCKNRK